VESKLEFLFYSDICVSSSIVQTTLTSTIKLISRLREKAWQPSPEDAAEWKRRISLG
jgi:hypothetical protein